MKAVHTIGYEGLSQEAFTKKLNDAGVTFLLDIRIRPNSRKPGFSKSGLCNLCRVSGIDYQHDRRLGTPEWIMKKLKETGVYDWEAYSKHLGTEEGAIQDAAKLVDQHVVCLLCYEADASECHRTIVALELSKRTGSQVIHI